MSQNYSIADKSYDKDTGDLTQFLVFWSNGEPEIRKASAENVLLFDPEDALPFENGMYEFLNGKKAIKLSEEPEVIIAPTNNEYAYILRVDGNTVETTPDQSGRVLEGIRAAAVDEDVEPLLQVYDNIMSSQVRRPVINALRDTFEGSGRIEKISRGWLIDEFYLVDWAASLWTIDDDPEEDDYQRSGSKAVKMDRSFEFVELNVRRDIDAVEVTIGGATKRLTEREMLFLSKVKWLLNRRHYHNDAPFWKYVDKDAAVDAKTGEPETSDDGDSEPNLDKFSL